MTIFPIDSPCIPHIQWSSTVFFQVTSWLSLEAREAKPGSPARGIGILSAQRDGDFVAWESPQQGWRFYQKPKIEHNT